MVIGATVVTAETWHKIPPELRETLMRIAREQGARTLKLVRELEQEAIQAMAKRGLQVVSVPPDALADWRAKAESIYPEIRGTLIPAPIFDDVLRLRDEYRNATGTPPNAGP